MRSFDERGARHLGEQAGDPERGHVDAAEEDAEVGHRGHRRAVAHAVGVAAVQRVVHRREDDVVGDLGLRLRRGGLHLPPARRGGEELLAERRVVARLGVEVPHELRRVDGERREVGGHVAALADHEERDGHGDAGADGDHPQRKGGGGARRGHAHRLHRRDAHARQELEGEEVEALVDVRGDDRLGVGRDVVAVHRQPVGERRRVRRAELHGLVGAHDRLRDDGDAAAAARPRLVPAAPALKPPPLGGGQPHVTGGALTVTDVSWSSSWKSASEESPTVTAPAMGRTQAKLDGLPEYWISS